MSHGAHPTHPSPRSRLSDALDKLTARLPLAARQAALPPDAAAMHRAVLRGFGLQGQPPGCAALARRFPGRDSAATLRRLAQADLVVLRPGTDPSSPEIAGAYPFTLEDTGHVVRVGPCETHAMCALDALGVGPLLDRATTVVSRCHVRGTPIHVRQDRARVVTARPSRDLHVGIAWRTPKGCAAHSLCREMVFLGDGAVARTWVGADADRREAYALEEALALAADFFRPLLD